MKITVVGTGYVGLVTGTCFAEIGHQVTCIDIDSDKVAQLQRGESPLYEPGLDQLLARNRRAGRLSFTTGFASVEKARVIFLAVGTPANKTGQADLQHLMAAVEEMAKRVAEESIIVIKSTVPVGTSEKVRERIGQLTQKRIDLVSNPEFLRGGNAVEDFMRPDRVVIGHREDGPGHCIAELYAPLMGPGRPILKMSNASAELAKYAANCFLATKISFINDMAQLCDLTGADIEQVREVMASDPRIGQHFLHPGLGFGGSCFPKDVKALLSAASERGAALEVVRAAQQINQRQVALVLDKLRPHLGELAGKSMAMWGVSFKPHTDDVREAPSLTLAQEIMAAGGSVHFYDPVASENFLREMGGERENLRCFGDMYQCLQEADALLAVTEWPEFFNPDWGRVVEGLRSPVLLDCRNIYSTQEVLAAGLTYQAVGKFIS